MKAFALIFILFCSFPVFSNTITPIAEVKLQTDVIVRGEVSLVIDYDEFVLTDETGSILVYFEPSLSVKRGDLLTVEGWVDEDFDLEIHAYAIVLEDGTRIEL